MIWILFFLIAFFYITLQDAITAIAWHPSSRYLATAGGDDRVIQVWHNAAGIKVQIEDLQGRMYRTRNENVKVTTRVRQVVCDFITSFFV